MSAPLGKLLGMQSLALNSEAAAPAPRHGGGAQHEKSIVRHVLVTITGNYGSWQQNSSHGPIWRINQEQAANIFAPDGAFPGPEVTEQLSRALVRKVTVLETNTNIDTVVGVIVDGLPMKEFTCNGDSASVYITGKGRVSTPQEIFRLTKESDLGIAWMKRFPKHTRHNLEREGAMHLDADATYWFVRQDHPVLYFIEQNKDQFGVPDMWVEPIQNGWFKVATDMFDYSIKSLREGILHHTPTTFDLNNLTVRLVRPDREGWINVSSHTVHDMIPEELHSSEDHMAYEEARRAAIERHMDKPRTLTLRLAMEYSLPDINATPGEGEEVVFASMTAAAA